jgi:hypothetical protein
MWFVAKVVSEDVIQFLGGYRNKADAIVECVGQFEDNNKWIGLIEYVGEYVGECPWNEVDIVFKFGPLLRVNIEGIYPAGNYPNDIDHEQYEVYEGVVVQ